MRAYVGLRKRAWLRWVAAGVSLCGLVLVTAVRGAELWRDDFAGSSPGWASSAGGGTINFNYGGTLLLQANGAVEQFPLVGRNAAFAGCTSYYRLRVRFQYIEVTPYGTTLAAGTGSFNPGNRQIPPWTWDGWEDILSIHQVNSVLAHWWDVVAFGGAAAYHVDRPVGSPDLNWHTVEVEVNGSSFVLRVDGVDRGGGAVPAHTPTMIYFGNPNYMLGAGGNWTDFRVDWVQVESDVEVPTTTCSVVGGTPGSGGWWVSPVQVGLSASDAWSGVAASQYQVDGGGYLAYKAPFTVVGDTAGHVVQCYSTDNAGNAETPASLSVSIDTVPPASAIASLGGGEWLSATVVVSGTASDATSGVALVRLSRDGGASWGGSLGTTSWSGAWDTTTGADGDYQVGSRAVDVAGLGETPSFLTVHVDNSGPASSLSLDGTAGNAGWWRSKVLVTVNASDGAGIGVAGSGYSVDGGGWAAYGSPFMVSGDGVHSVSYGSTDLLGNVEAPQTAGLSIDTVPPTTTGISVGVGGLGGWYVSAPVTVALSASDATSGVDFSQYRVDGGAWSLYSGSAPISGDGTRVVEFFSTDVAGNAETASGLTVRIDTVPPVASLAMNGLAGNAGWWRSPVTITLSGWDATSGLRQARYDLDGAGWAGYAAPFVVGGEGGHTLDCRTQDNAGLWSVVMTETLWIDSVAPGTSASLSGTLGLNGWYTDSVTVTLSASDATSGVDFSQYRVDGGPWSLYSGSAPIAGDGTRLVEFFSTDVAGNPEGVGAIDAWIDTVAPATSLTMNGVAGNAGWWRSAVTITLSASDATSGPRQTQYDLDEAGWAGYAVPFVVGGEGGHTVDCRTQDNAGLWESVQTDTLRIDSVSPRTLASLAGTLGLNGWYTDSVTVTLSAVDATSGVSVTLLDGSVVTEPVGYGPDGTYALPYYSLDVAGNDEAAHTAAFALDTVPPSAGVIGGSFCPGAGEVLVIQPTAGDATSGVESWVMSVADGGGTVLRLWSGLGVPGPVAWNGRDGLGNVLGAGTYTLMMRSSDYAGWPSPWAQDQVTIVPAPAPMPTPVPLATATPVPTDMPTPTQTPTLAPTPTGTAQPTATPRPTATPTPTPQAVAEAEPERPAGVSLAAAAFEDADSDAWMDAGELGLEGLRVLVEGSGWSSEYVADRRGMVGLVFPGPGEYEVTLLDRPGGQWQATTVTCVMVRVGEDGSVVLVRADGEELPIGGAEGAVFAFGLVLREVRLWLALTGAMLLSVRAVWVVSRRRAAAVRRLEEAVER
jgi:cell division septation protein DedD